MLINKISALELSRKFIKTALLVGHTHTHTNSCSSKSSELDQQSLDFFLKSLSPPIISSFFSPPGIRISGLSTSLFFPYYFIISRPPSSILSLSFISDLNPPPSLRDHNFFSLSTPAAPFCPPSRNYPTTNGSSVGIRTHCRHIFAFGADLQAQSMLIDKISGSDSFGNLLRVCCWLGTAKNTGSRKCPKQNLLLSLSPFPPKTKHLAGVVCGDFNARAAH